MYFVRLILAFVLPFAVFFTIGRPLTGVVALILQLTILGWPVAIIWAIFELGQFETEQKIGAAVAKATAVAAE